MTERPILFSDAMVRAILAGAKTQTRRVMTPQPIDECGAPIVGAYHPIVVRRGIEEPGPERWGASTEEQSWPCPYGRPGDRLYVREAWGHAFTYGGQSPAIAYRATKSAWRTDGARVFTSEIEHATSDGQRWRPSIHMPRWASRLTLEVTSVRVERVQSISEEDARAEGLTRHAAGWSAGGDGYDTLTARQAYAELWDEINGEREGCSWDANPWCWCVSFKRVEGT